MGGVRERRRRLRAGRVGAGLWPHGAGLGLRGLALGLQGAVFGIQGAVLGLQRAGLRLHGAGLGLRGRVRASRGGLRPPWVRYRASRGILGLQGVGFGLIWQGVAGLWIPDCVRLF